MDGAESERLIAFEAAMQELSELQAAASRYAALRAEAETLLGELMDLGRVLRQAARRGLFSEDAVAQSVEQVRRLRAAWLERLETLRQSDVYQRALAAYAADEQSALADVLPSIFADLERVLPPSPLFRPLALAAHRRSGPSPFRPPAEVAAEVETLARDGLQPRARGRRWWDADLPALELAPDLAAVDSPAVLSLAALPAGVEAFRDGEAIVVFTPRLRSALAVVLADRSDDSWYEATHGSYEEYRAELEHALTGRGLEVHVAPAWS